MTDDACSCSACQLLADAIQRDAEARAAVRLAAERVDASHGLNALHIPGLGRAGRESGATSAPAGSRTVEPEVT